MFTGFNRPDTDEAYSDGAREGGEVSRFTFLLEQRPGYSIELRKPLRFSFGVVAEFSIFHTHTIVELYDGNKAQKGT